MTTRTITPSDEQITDSVRSLLESNTMQETSIKELTKIVKDKHTAWIIGKKRMTPLVNSLKSSLESSSENNPYTKLDTPVHAKNIITTGRRNGRPVVNKELTSITNSPMLQSGSEDEWELPAEHFSRPGSGLKPRRPDSEYDGNSENEMDQEEEDEDEEEHVSTIQPRSIVFVPDDIEEEEAVVVASTEEEDLELQKKTITKLQGFFNRARVHNDEEAVHQEALVEKEKAITNLQTFFQRKNMKVEEIEEIASSSSSSSPSSPSSEFILPILPLAKYETMPAPKVEEEEDADLRKPSFNEESLEKEEVETTCNACMLM